MVWINEIPWHEMNVNDALTLRTTDPWAREWETKLRQVIYQWTHLPGDMMVSPYLESPLAIHSTGVGISEKVDSIKTDEASYVASRHFHIQIAGFEDLEKIQMPKVTHHEQVSEQQYQQAWDVFGDILPVKKVGIKTLWFTPWDSLIRLWGVQEAMIDLVERPELVNAAVSRFVDACMHELDQYEQLNLLSLGNDNIRVGSGGYACTEELPAPGFNPNRVRPKDLWGCSNAQIFSEVSPEMHWEFALRHDLRWLERWGLTYYGCCEPLDGKMEILKRIPNLRKVSMSPWVKLERAVKAVEDHYVFSYKPNPAFLAEDRWRPDLVRKTVQEVLDKTQDCRMEIILKDISTVRYQPQRLWEWENIIMELVEGR